MPIIFLISIGAVLFTILGGLFALKFKDKLHLILGFSAGALLGVAFFDLLPEAIELGVERYDVGVLASVIALGFAIFMVVDRLFVIHAHDDDSCQNESHRGKLGASSLAVHSFLDGMAIGLAFKVSSAVGIIVTTAVLVHDFSDGINTVNLILKNNGSKKQAFRWLLIDAAAPVLGVISTLFFTVSEASLGLILALFCGFFLYIGASDLLPESHHRHPTMLTTSMSVLGMLVLYSVIRILAV